MLDTSVLSRSGLARLLAFALGIFLFFNLVEDFSFFRMAWYQALRRDVFNPGYNTFAYVAAYGCCTLSLVILYCHAWRPIRYGALALTALTLTVFRGFKNSNGYGFTYHEASLLWGESAFIGDALRFFSNAYLLEILFSAGAVLAIAWLAARHVPRFRSVVPLVVPLIAIHGSHRMLESTYSKVYQTPIPFRLPLLAYYAYDHKLLYYGERDEPYIAPRNTPVVDHIVFIVGESIAGDMLGLNGSTYDTTPYLASKSGRIFNYGVVPAPSNLSSTTNIILQSGLRTDQIPDSDLRSLKNPNVFSYLQRAGYESFFIDAQTYSDKPMNMMTGFDVKRLDGHIHIRRENAGLAEYEMDFKAIDRIRRIVSEHDRSFIYLITTGAHFSYDAKYPPDRRVFEPTLSEERSGGKLEKTLNSYANAVRWSVDEFSRALFEAFEPLDRRILVIFTGDHGQSLRDAVDDEGQGQVRRPARWPHALPVDPPVEQAMVPLLLIPFGEGVHGRLSDLYDPSLRDRVSGFELFSSLLQLAGYDYGDIRSYYHYSIFDRRADRRKRVFVSGNLYGIGGGFYQNRLIESAVYLNEYAPDRRP